MAVTIDRHSMARFVAFLRAINVDGSRAVRMETLRRIFESFGFAKVDTFLASGNVVFESTPQGRFDLEYTAPFVLHITG